MSSNRNYLFLRGLVRPLVLVLCTGMLLFTAAIAAAQETSPRGQEDRGFFGSIVHWFEDQAAKFDSNLKNAGSQVDNFGREAGIAAKTTVDAAKDAAKDAADAVSRIPAPRVVSGHEKCTNAPNGAPDCVAAASNMCKAKGFNSGKSLDMTTAEVCPPEVLISGRNTGPECHDETFVSRVLCQ